MAREPGVNFSMKELDRLKCIQAVIDGNLKPGRAADRLSLTVRQIERLVIRYRAEGPIGLISRHRNRPGVPIATSVDSPRYDICNWL